MKITPIIVKQFEEDREKYGTATALHNILWQKASEDMMDLGVKRVRTENK